MLPRWWYLCLQVKDWMILYNIFRLSAGHMILCHWWDLPSSHIQLHNIQEESHTSLKVAQIGSSTLRLFAAKCYFKNVIYQLKNIGKPLEPSYLIANQSTRHYLLLTCTCITLSCVLGTSKYKFQFSGSYLFGTE